MIINQEDVILLIIDVQEKLLNAVFNKDSLERNANIISKATEILNIPKIVTEQYPQGLGESINGIKDNASVFVKTSFNALSDVNLQDELKALGKKQVIIFGIETHICVYQSVVALLELGYDVNVVVDACGSRSEFEYNKALNLMSEYGAKIKTTEMVLFELIKSSKHPNFKEIQSLIK